MAYDEYGFCNTLGRCPHCGASVCNNHEHHADCLINLPALPTKDSMEKLGPLWRKGSGDFKRLGGKPDDRQTTGMNTTEAEAYFMGFRCADMMQKREHSKAA